MSSITHWRRSRHPVILLFAGLLAAFAGAPAVPAGEPPSAPAAAVLERHIAAFARHDVDAIMADYTDASVLITPDGVLEGQAEIRALFKSLVEEFSAPEADVTIHHRFTHGPVAYVTWSAETPARRYELATDTLYVIDDRIHYQTFAAKTSAK